MDLAHPEQRQAYRIRHRRGTSLQGLLCHQFSGLYHCEAAAAEELGWEGAAAEAGAEPPRLQEGGWGWADEDGTPADQRAS